ncbi:predicted protein [Streptomyces viridochromogenes DSM 40736]|uniref:Predicted protein n=1 Tax=Streptomyces viridochromogenes (strain DSM 40736 / JCM 4977 / BCRC 1201 / Tue 494) TaxID=591159 RepID=D9X624_STRVT|nr:predicted protein [Streptomyces viridochromogenes DSM 40736]
MPSLRLPDVGHPRAPVTAMVETPFVGTERLRPDQVSYEVGAWLELSPGKRHSAVSLPEAGSADATRMSG